MSLQKKLMLFSLLAAVFSMPLSASVCHISLGLFILTWIAEGQWRRRITIISENPLILAYLFFFFLHLLGIIYSEDKANGFFDVEKKIFLFLIPLLMATTFNFDKKMAEWLFKGFVFICVITTLYCLIIAGVNYFSLQPQSNFNSLSLSLYQEFNPQAPGVWMYFSYVGLSSAVGMHPTFMALYLTFCILILFQLYLPAFQTYSFGQRISFILSFIYLGLIITLLSSRVLTIALFIIIITTLYYFISRHYFQGPDKIIMAAVFGFLACFLLINPVARYRNLQEPFTIESYQSLSGIYNYSIGIRLSMWHAGILSATEVNPIIGGGTGDVKQIVKQISDRFGKPNIMNTYDPHNQFLFTTIGLGVTGLCTLLFCFSLPAWIAWKEKNFFYLAFILVFMLVCTTESALESQSGIVFFAFFNSLIIFPYARLPLAYSKKLSYG